ncbi:hypothetical protein ACIHDR_14305 [Nocardia sp. NPDC052278]|uniref:hypothetical protein n=1 Tax=unclassified Nocardia TaxID=2637762 RepID=UPI0036887D9D
MVSSQHEAMHHLFRQDPGVFARTIRDLGLPFSDPIDVALLPTDLTEIDPLERRVDTLLRIETAESLPAARRSPGTRGQEETKLLGVLLGAPAR